MAGTTTHERARLANTIRHHPGDHEAIAAARAALKAAGLEARIKRDVASWPPPGRRCPRRTGRTSPSCCSARPVMAMPPDMPRGRPGQETPSSTTHDLATTIPAAAARSPRCAFLHPRHLTGCRQSAEPGSDYCARHSGSGP
jgi:hypothetical protein